MYNSQFQITDDYELEYIINNEPEVFKQLLSKFNVNSEFEFYDELITSFQPIVEIKNVKFRLRQDLINKQFNDIFERKELIYRNNESIKIKSREIELLVKLSREHQLSKPLLKNLKVINMQRRLRLTIIKKPFKFDFTIRIWPLKPTNDILNLKLSKDNILNPVKLSGFKTEQDIEIEILNCDKFDSELIYQKLICLLTDEDSITLNKLISKSFNFTRCPQVGLLTTSLIQQINKNDFVWSDKMDGVRTLIVLFDGKVYSYRNVDKLKLLKYNIDTNLDITILDCEQIEDEFYAFDIYYFDGRDIRGLSYERRLNVCDNIKTNNLKLYKLQIHNIESFEQIIEYARIERQGKDGIVLHSKHNLNTNDKWYTAQVSFKLKPLRLNTIDFFYRKHKDNVYYLYLYGSVNDLMFNLKQQPYQDRYSREMMTEHKNSDIMILFDSPYCNNVYQTSNLGKFTDEEVEGKICESEFDLETKSFKPIRIRNDKLLPNYYQVGMTNMSIIYSPPSVKEVIPLSYYHQKAKTYLYDRLKLKCENYFPKPIVTNGFGCLYINCGNGFDIQNIYNLGCTNLFCLSRSNDDLVNCVKEANNAFNNLNISHVLNIIDTMNKHRMTINVLNNSCELNKIEEELLSINEFKIDCIELMILNKMDENEVLKYIDKFKSLVNKDTLFIYEFDNHILELPDEFETVDIFYPKNDKDFQNNLVKNDVSENHEDYNYLLFKMK